MSYFTPYHSLDNALWSIPCCAGNLMHGYFYQCRASNRPDIFLFLQCLFTNFRHRTPLIIFFSAGLPKEVTFCSEMLSSLRLPFHLRQHLALVISLTLHVEMERNNLKKKGSCVSHGFFLKQYFLRRVHWKLERFKQKEIILLKAYQSAKAWPT